MVISIADFRRVQVGGLGRFKRCVRDGNRRSVYGGFLSLSGPSLHCRSDYSARGVRLRSQLGCAPADADLALSQLASVVTGAFLRTSQTFMAGSSADAVVGEPSRGIRRGNDTGRV